MFGKNNRAIGVEKMLMAEINERDKKRIKASIVSATNKSEYGLAVLLSVLRFHKCESTMEKLRILSGTNEAGCNLFGLQRAAIASGFACKGYKMDVETIKQCTFPAILSIFTKAQQQDYVVFYGTLVTKNELLFVIGHPADGITYLSQRQLESLWVSKFCLILEPDQTVIAPITFDKNQTPSLWESIVSQKTLFVVLGILSMLQAAIIIFPTMWVVKQFFENWIEQQRQLLLIYTAIAVAVLFIIKYGLTKLQNRFSLLLAIPVISAINERFVGIFGKLPKQFLNSFHIEKHLQHQKRIEKVADTINEFLVSGMFNMAIVLLALGALFIHAYELALIYLVFIPALFLWTHRIKYKLLQLEMGIEQNHSTTDTYFVESCRVLIAGFEMDKTKSFSRRLMQSNKNLYSSNFNNKAALRDFDSVAVLLITLFASIAIAASLGLFLNNGFSGKGLTLAIFLIFLLTKALHVVYKLPIAFGAANAVLQGIDKLEALVRVNKNTDTAPAKIEHIAVENLVYTTPDYNKNIVNNVSFTTKRGSITAVIGANGCGKSMIAAILAGHYPITAGSITVNGTANLSHIDPREWERLVAVVSQDPYIFPGTVLENIMLADGKDDLQHFFKFVQQYRLEAFLQIFPKREQTHIGDGYMAISQGQKQMVALLRAVYIHPQLLILDDILQQLDDNGKAFAFFILNTIKAQTNIVLLTTDIASIDQFCDTKIYI